ncbi:MAG: hypothetical protein U0169_25020 [Polyangiaceae bacterium]
MRAPLRSTGPVSRLASVGVLALATGCSANVAGAPAPENTDADVVTPTSAIVVVERTASTDGDRAHAVARFVRARHGSVDDDALRMVGAFTEIPKLGSCERVSNDVQARRTAGLDLVDVGTVTLEAALQRSTLHTRRLPDVTDLVAGVLYARGADDGALPTSVRYDLRVSGASQSDVPAFAASAQAPADLVDFKVAGQDATTSAVVVLPQGAVDLAWEPGDDVRRRLRRLERRRSGSRCNDVAGPVRCAFADVGRGAIPQGTFTEGQSGTFTFHRLRSEPFRSRGIDVGEIRFDFARAATFVQK